MKEVAIIMPVYEKSEDCLAVEYRERAERSLIQYGNAEIIEVNNGSPHLDRTGMMADLCCNLGFGIACNIGFEIAFKRPNAKFIGQMNTDAELVEDSISILLSAMTTHDLDVAMPEHYENCQHYNLSKSDEVMPNWRFGAFWIARREALERVREKDGFIFDPRYEMCYWEDTDLWRRMEEMGMKVAGYRGTWVKHKGGVSSVPDMRELFLKNKERFEKRHGAIKKKA